MKILITGSGGMVGKNLSLAFTDHELLTPTHSELDLLNSKKVDDYLKTNAPELVIHCAGRVGGIQANIQNPVAFLYENLSMGQNIVMAARQNGIKKFLNLGSSCMYPRSFETAISEDQILKGELEPTNEGYALAKIAVAKLCEYIRREDPRFHYVTIIPCNLYGSYDKFDPKHSHMIPAVIRKIHEAKSGKQKEVEIWGDGEARREFMHVDDLVDFVQMAITRFDQLPDTLNVGLGIDYTINEYYQAIAKVIGYQGQFTHDLSRPVGMRRKLVDVQKLRDFNWTHRLSLEEGIKRTYNYFLSL